MNKEFQKIVPFFNLPLLEASVKLGIEMDELRRICKANGLFRWPYSYKRKNNTLQDSAFSKFTLLKTNKLYTLPKIIKKKSTQTSPLISKIEVKNLLN